MENKLYIIASPIGNINDCSKHLIDTLEFIDILYCEDTRNTNKLLNILNIKNKPKLISYHKFNEHNITNDVIKNIKDKNCGLISDAGYPTISDPGYLLINECHKQNIKIDVVDGPSAIMHSIVQSGFCSNGFSFIGFLPNSRKEIIEYIYKYANYELPIVCFESVHRINNTILILKELIPNSLIYIGRELTKKFEEYTIDIVSNLDDIIEKGEFTIIINFSKNDKEKINDNIIFDEIKNLIDLGLKYKNACKYIANKFNVSSNDLYKKFLDKFKVY